MTPQRAPNEEVESYLSAVAVALTNARRRAVLAHLAAEETVPLEVLADELAGEEGDASAVDDLLHELEIEHVPVLTGIGLATFDPERRVLGSTATTHTLLACADDMPKGKQPGAGDEDPSHG